MVSPTFSALHYPAHFYAAVFDQLGDDSGGLYPRLVYVTEARRHGLTIEGPCINSRWQPLLQGRTIQCGLGMLAGQLHRPTLEAIHQEARITPFTGIPELLARVAVPHHPLQQLIAAGALDRFAPNRRAVRWTAQGARGLPHGPVTLLDARPMGDLPVPATEPLLERAGEEYAVLGFTLSVVHPLACYAGARTGQPVVLTEQLVDLVDRQVRIAGVVVTGRRIRTEAGKAMLFLSVCDASGVTEVTLFERVLERLAVRQEEDVVLVTGVVREDAERGIGLDAQTLAVLPAPNERSQRG